MVGNEEGAPSSSLARRCRELEERVIKEIRVPSNERWQYSDSQTASLLFDMHTSDSRNDIVSVGYSQLYPFAFTVRITDI